MLKADVLFVFCPTDIFDYAGLLPYDGPIKARANLNAVSISLVNSTPLAA